MLHQENQTGELNPLRGAVFTATRQRYEDRIQACNALLELSELNNTYIAIRHGQSEANIARIHSGNQDCGALSYGLTPEGKEQIRNAVSSMKAFVDTDDVVLISSAFLRTQESAAIVQEVLGIDSVMIDRRIGERGAGSLEGYQSTPEEKRAFGGYIRGRDAEDDFNLTLGLESPAMVMARVTACIKDLEDRYSGKTIILVSHHDTLKILRTAFLKERPGSYHQLEKLSNAGVIHLNRDWR